MLASQSRVDVGTRGMAREYRSRIARQSEHLNGCLTGMKMGLLGSNTPGDLENRVKLSRHTYRHDTNIHSTSANTANGTSDDKCIYRRRSTANRGSQFKEEYTEDVRPLGIELELRYSFTLKKKKKKSLVIYQRVRPLGKLLCAY